MSSRGAIPPSRVFRHSEHVVASRLGDAGVLVHLRSNQIFELNATGVRVWELIGEGHDLEGIEQRLEAEFDVDRVRLHREIAELIGALCQQGLLDDGSGV